MLVGFVWASFKQTYRFYFSLPSDGFPYLKTCKTAACCHSFFLFFFFWNNSSKLWLGRIPAPTMFLPPVINAVSGLHCLPDVWTLRAERNFAPKLPADCSAAPAVLARGQPRCMTAAAIKILGIKASDGGDGWGNVIVRVSNAGRRGSSWTREGRRSRRN